MNPFEAARLAGSAGLDALAERDAFHRRHLGVDGDEARALLAAIDAPSVDALIAQTVPASIRLDAPLALPDPVPEHEALAELHEIAQRNQVWRTYLGTGYHGTLLPEAIRRNVLENPGWYTAYTPYQAEISQGRLEALLNFQQMVSDLTGLPVANASLLDEATAAAEAMTLIRRSVRKPGGKFLIDAGCHPQVIAVMRTRAQWAGIETVVADPQQLLQADGSVAADALFGAHLQNPDTWGRVRDLAPLIDAIHAVGGMASVGCDPLSLLLVRSPGSMGADVAIGSAQRFGVPMGGGGPHAAFMAVRNELVRSMPGRIIGVSRDASGQPALRMALQTREQHIRRDKATSNICTAQALLANMAAFYAIWHGPQGLARIALRVSFMTRLLVSAVEQAQASGHSARLRPVHDVFFDTVVFASKDGTHASSAADAVRERAQALRINLRYFEPAGSAASSGASAVGVSFDETVNVEDVRDVAYALTGIRVDIERLATLLQVDPVSIPQALRRTDAVLTHPVFSRYHSETEFMRYLKRLENKDYSLVHGMIPLGSCTMKLNAAAEMTPVSWPQFASLHPFAPAEQAAGYTEMIGQLGEWLAEITGFAKVSFQPNSGAQGEYAGLLAIRNYLAAQGQGYRDVCLIPSSAHGTNPATAQMMGMRIVVVACDASGNVDVDDLSAKIAQHRDRVAALMVTYPSTHGVFEHAISQICELVHAAGGQVYMDGANMNAQSGLCKPGLIGADVCHLNLHKTFCIPHGGGGPGMGPIGVAAHLAPYLPSDPQQGQAAADANGAVSAAAYGSASILAISWMYIRMMGASGIRRATETAILNANYIASRLKPYFAVLYAGDQGRVAHECILDLRQLKSRFGVNAEDIAKRLMDYGFHAPTLSFPVADTLMIEPTESESRTELDRFCDAMIAIHGELARIESGEWDAVDNPLKNAPHTAVELAGEWSHRYTRAQAAYPVPGLRTDKFWPAVKRVDNAAGDRQLVCTCPPMEAYMDALEQTE